MLKNPNFFIIGAEKAETTSLYIYISAHPDIYISLIKEPNFFCSDIKKQIFVEDYKYNTKLYFDEYFAKEILEVKHIAFVENMKHFIGLFRNSEIFKILKLEILTVRDNK
jgi:hypothetical protein